MSEPTTPTYNQLAAHLAYLTQLADVTGGLVELDQMRPLALEVKLASVKALLFARQSDILDQDNVAQFPLFLELLNGVALEVESVVGTEPTDPAVRRLAVHAVGIGVAAQIELAAYPEQQLGDDARATQLQARFESTMKRLATASASGEDGQVVAAPAPQGSFPEPWPDLDPMMPPRTGWLFGY